MPIFLHHNDLPPDFESGNIVAVDTETMGLTIGRDRLCVVQLSTGDGDAHLIQFDSPTHESAPNLKKIMENPDILKIFHFARFDLAVLEVNLNITCAHIYCTKIASILTRTYADRHGLREICLELLNVTLDKQKQSSDWGVQTLSEEQKIYAANDVLYLHALKTVLDEKLHRTNRTHLAQACFDFLPTRARLDLAGWPNKDIFAHDVS